MPKDCRTSVGYEVCVSWQVSGMRCTRRRARSRWRAMPTWHRLCSAAIGCATRRTTGEDEGGQDGRPRRRGEPSRPGLHLRAGYDRSGARTRRDFTFWALLFIFMGMQVPVSYFITGGSVTAGLTLGQAFTTTIVAVIIGFAIFALVGVIGWQTGASTMVCTRPAFGIVGSVPRAMEESHHDQSRECFGV